MSDAATRQDLRDAVSELKLYVVERESAWVKWIIGIQITYFVLTLGVVYFAVSHVR